MMLLVTGFGTTIVVAAYGIGTRVSSFIIIPALGLSMATTTLVGQNVGASPGARRADPTHGDHRRIRLLVHAASLGTGGIDSRPAGLHYASMRTTLTLEPDVVQLLKEEERRQGKSFKAVVNDAIRRGLAPQARTQSRRPFRVRAHRTVLRAGSDPAGFNRLADELEDEAVAQKATRPA